MSKIFSVEVDLDGQKEAIHVKRLRYRQQMRLFGVLHKDSKPGDDMKPESIGAYQIELIASSVCDADGKTLYTVDDVDAWAEDDGGTDKIIAYTKAITAALTPSHGQAAGN